MASTVTLSRAPRPETREVKMVDLLLLMLGVVDLIRAYEE
jgi:hypothetical protein